MKLQKPLFSLLFILIFYASAFSQGFYVKTGGGYALGINKQNLPNIANAFVDENGYTYNQFWLALGQGIVPEMEIGYMFTDKLGFALNASYLFGSENVATLEYDQSENYVHQTFYSEMLFLSPNFVFEPMQSDFSPYLKFGVVIGTGKFYKAIEMLMSDEKTELQQVYSGGYPFGFNTAFGVNANLSDVVSIYAEASALLLSWAPEQSKLTSWTVNGDDQLADLPTYNTETEYVESLSLSSGNPNEPSQSLKSYYGFDSLSLRLGVRINF
jgi:hypothetical protein